MDGPRKPSTWALCTMRSQMVAPDGALFRACLTVAQGCALVPGFGVAALCRLHIIGNTIAWGQRLQALRRAFSNVCDRTLGNSRSGVRERAARHVLQEFRILRFFGDASSVVRRLVLRVITYDIFRRFEKGAKVQSIGDQNQGKDPTP